MTKQKTCDGCPLTGTCAYPALFAPPPPEAHQLQKFAQIPVPYVIEPPAWGERTLHEGEPLHFHMILIGSALKELPLIILAWRRAMARGVGAADGTAEIESVTLCAPEGESVVFTPASGVVTQHGQLVPFTPPVEVNAAANAAADATPDTVTLYFETPLRLQQNGKALAPHRLDARTLLMALVRRINLLAEFHAGGPLIEDFSALAGQASTLTEQRDLVWRDWVRYSSRQKQAMALGGVMGRWQLEGNLAPFVPWLHLGQWLHVGKEAAFGLGRYQIISASQEVAA